jgi:hypothetical protein
VVRETRTGAAEVDNLPTEDKSALLRVIGGFLRDVKTKQAYAS